MEAVSFHTFSKNVLDSQEIKIINKTDMFVQAAQIIEKPFKSYSCRIPGTDFLTGLLMYFTDEQSLQVDEN